MIKYPDLSLGNMLHEAVAKVINPDVQISERRLTRTSGRLLEEGTELALACGMSAVDILGHVVDAIHNEARKDNWFPTDFKGLSFPSNNPNIIVEIADCKILLDYIRFLANIPEAKVAFQTVEKIDLLHHRAVAGELKEHDELIYKASLNR